MSETSNPHLNEVNKSCTFGRAYFKIFREILSHDENSGAVGIHATHSRHVSDYLTCFYSKEHTHTHTARARAHRDYSTKVSGLSC